MHIKITFSQTIKFSQFYIYYKIMRLSKYKNGCFQMTDVFGVIFDLIEGKFLKCSKLFSQTMHLNTLIFNNVTS